MKVRRCKTGVWPVECGHATQAAAINEGMQGRAGDAAEAAAQIRFDDGVSRGEPNRTLPRPARPQLHPFFLSRTRLVFIDHICANAVFFCFVCFVFSTFYGSQVMGLGDASL